MTRLSTARRVGLTAGLLSAALVLSGCEWSGLNSVSLPGTEGRGDGAYEVGIQMPNVTTLTENSPVLVDDVTVGSVSKIEVQDWHALVTVSLNGDVDLPENSTAKIGQTSLLGSAHVALAPPVGEAPKGKLADGDVIPLDRAGVYPTTEQTLSSLSVVLNGGGLAQLQDITSELNKALDGREDAVRDLLPQLDTLVGSLDRQRNEIVSAMEGINRLADTAAKQTDTISNALDAIPPALEVLVDQRQDITNAMVSLGQLSDVANRLIQESGDDFATNVRALVPTLSALANSGESLTQVLGVLLTFPFPQAGINNVIRGDYANLGMTIDLTVPRLELNFLSGTPMGARLGSPEGILAKDAGVAGEAQDPLRAPLQTPAAKPSDEPKPAAGGGIQIPGLPPINIPGLPLGEPAP
ncbi:MCE family protein [Prescottella agglutinans]|uniref:MCE family protein n=1 Tax=Prescottella agglutinans TaxID=1644129 RepID=A0A438BAL8_9NOCA|nr:MCE family protein [Prescottella agglutinans]RVW08068.1 MCE family protein [Prescottella agglutinans]